MKIAVIARSSYSLLGTSEVTAPCILYVERAEQGDRGEKGDQIVALPLEEY